MVIERSQPETVSAGGAGVFYATHIILVLSCAFAGLFYLWDAAMPDGERRLPISFYNLASQDAPWLVFCVLVYPASWVLCRYVPIRRANAPSKFNVLCLAAVVTISIFAGQFFIYHDFPLSMDEFMMRWHSDLIQEGQLLGRPPEVWWPHAYALRPGFLLFDDVYQFWVPGYRPATSMLHAGMSKIGLGTLMNAFFCGGAVILLWLIARREFADQPGAIFWALVLFVTGPQFLITGMTPYTMNAHLFASLLWVWLFTTDTRAAHLGAIVVGCYALGLHQVHVHSFLALPFLLHLLFVKRKWILALAYGVAYGMAILGWIFWIDLAIWLEELEPIAKAAGPSISGDTKFVKYAVTNGLSRHGWQDLSLWTANLIRLISWQNLAFLPLIAIAVGSFRKMPLTLRLMGWSVLTSLIPYVLLMPSQGHGWGYRYLHQALGQLALLACFGWVVLRGRGWDRQAQFVTLLALISLVVALPMRAVQVEALVRPFASATEYLQSVDADVVILDEADIWYGRDLVRNDPLLRNRPVILALSQLSREDLSALCNQYQVVFEDAFSLRDVGMMRGPSAKVVGARGHERRAIVEAGKATCGT